jgi:Cytochrome P450
MEPRLKEQCVQLVEALHERMGMNGCLNIAPVFDALAFDIAGVLLFGQNFRALAETEQHPYVWQMQNMFHLVSEFMYISWVAKFCRLALTPPNYLAKGRDYSFEFLREAHDKFIAEEKPDFRAALGELLNATDPETGKNFQWHDIISNLLALMYTFFKM